jgi:hypothetical protein
MVSKEVEQLNWCFLHVNHKFVMKLQQPILMTIEIGSAYCSLNKWLNITNNQM